MRPVAALAIGLTAAAAGCGDLLGLGEPPANLRGGDRPDATIAKEAGEGEGGDATLADVDGIDRAEGGEPGASDAEADTTAAFEAGEVDTLDATLEGDAADLGLIDTTGDPVGTADAAPDRDAGDAPSADAMADFLESPTANPMGYRRSDGVSSVVYRSAVNDVGEVESSGSGWRPPEDLSRLGGATTAALGNVFGYVRSDGTNDVVYVGADNDIHHIELGVSGWRDSNLAFAGGAQRGIATGDPSAFVRSDGVSAVVYRTADNDVHELALVSGSWTDLDLSISVGAPAAASDPVGFVRADGVNSVIFRAFDGTIYEISSPMEGGPNQLKDLRAAASGGCAYAQGKPRPYLRSDGVSSVVYRDSQSVAPSVWEIALVSGAWACYDMIYNSNNPAVFATGGDPVPYVRGDRSLAVVFRRPDDHIFELVLPLSGASLWHVSDLSQLGGAPAAASDPMGYVGANGASAVVFRSRGDNHTRELELTTAPWTAADLSGP